MKRGSILNQRRSKTSLVSLSRDPKIQNILKNIDLDSDDDNAFTLNPDAPLLKSLQENLHQQLTKNFDSVDINLRDLKNRKKKLAENREDIGYHLYGFQRKLAYLHLKLRMLTNSIEKNIQIRKHKEEKLMFKQMKYNESNQFYIEQLQKYEILRNEYEALNNTIREIEEKNQQKLSDAVVMKRMAYKTEKDVKEQEMAKQDQDFYINKLMERISDIHKKIDKYESQIVAQKEETKRAQLAVYHATFEYNRMNFEREQLLKDWDSAVIGVKFRIMTLERIQNAVEEQDNEITALKNEISIIKNQKNEQKDITDNHLKVMKRMDDRIQHIDKKIEDIQIKKKKLEEKLNLYMNQMVLKQNQLNVLFDAKSDAKKEYEEALESAHELNDKVRKKEEKRENKSRAQSKHARDVANLQRAVYPMKRRLEMKKQEFVELQNEKIRTNFLKLTLDNQCAIYQERLQNANKYLHENEGAIARCEEEHKENKIQIEKNLKMIERLNQKYESVHKKDNSEDSSPIELKVKEMQKQIQELAEKSSQKQNEWIRLQTEFVQLTRKCEELDKGNNEQKTEIAIAQRKVERAKMNLNEVQKENQKYQIHVRVCQNELDRVNKQMVDKTPIVVDSNIIDALKTKEKEAAEIENKIGQTFQIRKEIAEEMLDVERATAIWEKRIKMVEELEQNFNREKNEKELLMMKNEVRRLEESLATIKSQQRKLVEQMQNALRRRETCKSPNYLKDDQIINEGIKRLQEMKDTKDENSLISEGLARLQMMKEEPELANKDDDENNDEANVEKQIAEELNQIENEIAQNEQIIRAETKAQKETKSELDEINDVVNEFEKQFDEFSLIIKDQKKLNQNLETKFDHVQQRIRMLNGIKLKENLELTSEFEKVQRQIIDMTMMIDGLCFQYPDLSESFKNIQEKLSNAFD